MWTATTRAHHARKGLALPSDLTDNEWAVLKPCFPPPCHVGRPRKWPMRRIIEALLYLLRGGLPWRMLPSGFPPATTVQRWFYRWRDDGTWQRINHYLLQDARITSATFFLHPNSASAPPYWPGLLEKKKMARYLDAAGNSVPAHIAKINGILKSGYREVIGDGEYPPRFLQLVELSSGLVPSFVRGRRYRGFAYMFASSSVISSAVRSNKS